MLKKLSLLMLVALMGIVASGTMALAWDIKTVSPTPKNNKEVMKGKPVSIKINVNHTSTTAWCYVKLIAYVGSKIINDKDFCNRRGRVWHFQGNGYQRKNVFDLTPYISDVVDGEMVSYIVELYPNGSGSGNMVAYAQGSFNVNSLVWPGDTDNDGDVDAADENPIKTYRGVTGPARGGSIAWEGQSVPDGWSPPEAAYADADGNGKVAAADVLIVGLNWGKTH